MADKKPRERKDKFETNAGIPIRDVYDKAELPEEQPGEFPYTRGIHKNMYRGRLWTMRQYAGFSTAVESNKRYHYLLKQGTMGLSVAFDLPTQIGYDSDHDFSEGEVGKVGVAIDSLRDMEILFDGIELEQVSTSMTINSTAYILLAMYIALAKKQGADIKKISGTVQNDILKEYAARGTYIYPPKPSMRLITDIFEFCSREVPRWNTISISGYHIREAGANAVQELAFTLANGKAYLQAALDKGLDINVFARRLSFFFNAHNNLFEEVGKYRAARRMWAKITKDLGATDPRARMLRFHTQTGGSTLTAQQPKNNIARVTIQALAGILGGTQSLHTNSYDEALSLPSEEAVSIALRTQQIIAQESGVADTVDPLGGSYFVEQITGEIEERAYRYLERIEDMGGAVVAIEQGYIQEEIARSAYEFQKRVEENKEIIVGVNKFQTEEAEMEDLLRVDDSIREKQIQHIRQIKAERDGKKVEIALKNIGVAAREGSNIMPSVIKAVEVYATLGEVADVLRKEFGEYSA